MIQNEAYTASNEDLLSAGKSGLIQNDMIEPRPRTVENVLYESGSEQGEAENDFPELQRPHDLRRHAVQHQQSPQHIKASPIYESIPTANVIDAQVTPFQNLRHSLPSAIITWRLGPVACCTPCTHHLAECGETTTILSIVP